MAVSGDIFVVAVSGGPDSMCLLDLLCSMAPDLGIRIHAAHLNHHMRDQAPKDAEMVRDFAASLGVSCTVGHADVNEIARGKGIGVEEAGRDARYAFLRQVKTHLGAQKIALGHNLNDQAETVLMRLLRGAGTQGLAGIPPVNDDIVRPIIGVARRLTEGYCRERNIPTIQDVYNLDLKYTRNAIRLAVIPELEERFNPSLVENLGQVATALRWDADLLEEMARETFLGVSTKQARVTSVDGRALTSMPPSLSSRVLESAWRECSHSSGNLPIRHIQELLWSSENVNSLPEGVTAEKSGGLVVFYPKPPIGLEVELPWDGVTDVPELGVSFLTRTVSGSGAELSEEVKRAGNVHEGHPSWFTEPVARIDRDKLTGPLIVRTRRRGDRFRPLGMEGREQKLQDFLTHRKVPKFYRDLVPVVCSGGDIVCVAGMRLSHEYKIDRGTTCMTEVEMRPYLRCSRNYATIWRSCPTSGRVYS